MVVDKSTNKPVRKMETDGAAETARASPYDAPGAIHITSKKNDPERAKRNSNRITKTNRPLFRVDVEMDVFK
jgi:hypothetical protein